MNAFEALWEKAEPHAVYFLNKREASPDLLGIVKTLFWEKLYLFDDSGPVRGWIRALVRTVAERDRFEMAREGKKAVKLTATFDVVAADPTDPDSETEVVERGRVDDIAVNRVVRTDLDRAIATLTPRQLVAVNRWAFCDIGNASDKPVRDGIAALAKRLPGYAEHYPRPSGTLPLVSQRYGGNGGRLITGTRSVEYKRAGPEDYIVAFRNRKDRAPTMQ